MKVTYRDFDSEYNIPSFGTIENVKKIDVNDNFVTVISDNGKKIKIKFEKLISIESGESNEK